MSEVEMDFGQLRAAQRALEEAAAAVDALGERMPYGGDYGVAAPLVELVLGIQADAAARLGAEATVVGLAVGLAADGLAYTDSQQAVDLITIAPDR